MNKQIYIAIILSWQSFLFAQKKDNMITFPQDSLTFNYHLYKVESVMNNCMDGWYNSNKLFHSDVKNIYCLNIANKSKFDFFLSNINSFNHIKALSINTIGIKDFNFLNKLPSLEYVSIGTINNSNIDSFVENLSNNKKIKLLDIYGLKMKKFPKELNKLKYIESLELRNTKLKWIDIDLNLKLLTFSYNNNLKYIKTYNIDYVTFSFNNLRKIPDGLSKSNNLLGLEFSANHDLKVKCPVEGFEKLEIFDVFGQPPGNTINLIDDCFIHNKNLQINYPSGVAIH